MFDAFEFDGFEILLNPQITMNVVQEFLCLEITQIIQSRHVVKQHKIEAVKKMLETIELAEHCYSKYALCLAVHIPSFWVWYYFDGLAGLNMSMNEETHDLREMVKIWVHKLTQIGNKVAQSLDDVNKELLKSKESQYWSVYAFILAKNAFWIIASLLNVTPIEFLQYLF
ncbi:hypothetical protein RFI_29338 [Reticulomyxa filosa]|uniref:Uncharacterized protein n=1 Tax=Reticulomyxa filosa TaxID=46433 RepID=X6M3K6_RETFI|nr:hypothetical protein RFI_29338 [Reticulomyxa filosa]|eukprot:ETO08052.1 hypothetical protein RFI_29338 [Reticulomyxa filosa]